MTDRSRILPMLVALALGVVLPSAARPAEKLRFNTAEARHQKDHPTPAREFSSGVLALMIPLTDLAAPAVDRIEIRCAAHAGVQGVRVDFTLRYFDAERNLLGETTKRARTRADGWTPPLIVPPLIEGVPEGSIFSAVARPLGGKRTEAIEIQCVYASQAFCLGSVAPICS